MLRESERRVRKEENRTWNSCNLTVRIQELESIGIELPDNDQTDGKKSDKKSKKKIGADKDKIAPSSILMIGIAIAMAALTGD